MTRWTDDPLEIARFLDGEVGAAERAAREADLARDPRAAERVSRAAAFLAVIRSARAAEPKAPPGLEARVRAALAAASGAPVLSLAAARRRRRLAAASVAAALLLAVGAWLTSGRVPESVASDRPEMLAAKALLQATRGEGGLTIISPLASPACGETATASPHRFPPVERGDFELRECRPIEGQDASLSVLRREGKSEDVRGLVVVPADGKTPSTDVGYTRLPGDDIVVFDVAIRGARYFLSAKWSEVKGTSACAACHGPPISLHPERNPHNIFERPLLSR